MRRGGKYAPRSPRAQMGGCRRCRGDFLSRMLMRSLCTGVLALLAWLPVGHAQSRVLRGNPRDPALAATSALDIAADSPSRLGSANDVSPRPLPPPRHPGMVRGGDGAAAVEAVFGQEAT